MKISLKIPLIISAVIIAFFSAFSWYQSKITRENAYNNTTNKIEETTDALSGNISNWLNERLDIVNAMSQLMTENDASSHIRTIMQTPAFEDKFLQFFGGLDTNGRLITNDPNYNPKDWDARKRPWYPVAKSHDRAALTEPYNDALTNELLISAVANIYNNETGNVRNVGAFGGDISLKSVSDALNSVNFNNAGYVFLVNAKGQIISHPDNKLYNKNISALFDGNRLNLSQEFQDSTVNGKDVIAYFQPLKNVYSADWSIGVVVDRALIMADANKQNREAIIGAILGALLCSLIAFFFMRSLVINPLNELTDLAEQISLGKTTERLDNRYTSRKDEIGSLANGFERMRKSLRIAMSRIAQQKKG